MKVILEDFDYKGIRFDKYEVDFPDLEDLWFDDLALERVPKTVKEKLDDTVWEEISTRC